MSHFTEINTRFKNLSVLKSALNAMGYVDIACGENLEIRGYFGDSEVAELRVHAGKNYDIGFIENEQGSYDMVGDWEVLPRILKQTQGEFLNTLRTEYAKKSVLSFAKNNGYEVVERYDEETQTTEMVVEKW